MRHSLVYRILGLVCLAAIQTFALAPRIVWSANDTASPDLKCPKKTIQSNEWYPKPNESPGTAIVFVHGILSNSRDAWCSEPKKFQLFSKAEGDSVYWPNMVLNDKEIADLNVGVFLGGYFNSLNSGTYAIPDAAKTLLFALREKKVMGMKRIVFIGHSTGGLVVRYMLDRYHAAFRGKAVGVVLVASPTNGSMWANFVAGIRRHVSNDMAGQLERGDTFSADLRDRFSESLDEWRKSGEFAIDGIELFETESLVPTAPKIVDQTQTTSTFYRAIVPETDHISIAKPRQSDAEHGNAHTFLRAFLRDKFQRLPVSVSTDMRTSAPCWGIPTAPNSEGWTDLPDSNGTMVATIGPVPNKVAMLMCNIRSPSDIKRVKLEFEGFRFQAENPKGNAEVASIQIISPATDEMTNPFPLKSGTVSKTAWSAYKPDGTREIISPATRFVVELERATKSATLVLKLGNSWNDKYVQAEIRNLRATALPDQAKYNQ